MPRSQVMEIWGALKSFPYATIDDLVEETGWNRDVVELTMKLLVEQGMAQRFDIHGSEPRYEVIMRGRSL